MASETTISASSKISVALLGGIFGVTIAATWGGARWAASVDNRLRNIEERVLQPEENRWSEHDMRIWIERARRANPAMEFPGAVYGE